MKRSLRLTVLLLVVAVIGLVFSPLNHSSARNVQSSEGITGTQGLPEDVAWTHLGSIGVFPLLNLEGTWFRPHAGPFIWGKIEPAPGAFRWDEVDRQVATWQGQRLAILATIWPFASWDQESCHGSQPRLSSDVGFFRELGPLRYSPCDTDAYTAWLAALVERYDGDGIDDMPGLRYPIRHWEILNEPELRLPDLVFFQEGPEAYLALLRLSYETVKTADPHAVVLLGGQASMFQEEHVNYWRSVLQQAQGVFDLGNIHAIGITQAFYAPKYRAFLDELGYEDKLFWITESAVHGDTPEASPTEDRLAQLTLIRYASAFAHDAEVIFRVDETGPNRPRLGKLQNRVLTLMAHTIGDFATAERLADNAVRFQIPDGSIVYALWDNALLLSWEFGGTAKVITYQGEESTQDVSQVVADVPMLACIGECQFDFGPTWNVEVTFRETVPPNTDKPEFFRFEVGIDGESAEPITLRVVQGGEEITDSSVIKLTPARGMPPFTSQLDVHFSLFNPGQPPLFLEASDGTTTLTAPIEFPAGKF